jgi:hypothetical protein
MSARTSLDASGDDQMRDKGVRALYELIFTGRILLAGNGFHSPRALETLMLH